MCTIGLNRELNVLFKNRDKNVHTQEEVVMADGYIALRTIGAKYYSLGFNKFGCGFVSAAVNTPEWTKLTEDGEKEEAQALFKKENKGLLSPMILVSEMLPRIRKAEEWVTALSGFDDDFRGYNILFADLYSAKIVEVFKKKRIVNVFTDNFVRTNHFQNIDFGPKYYKDYPNSFDRYQYVEKELGKTRRLEDIFAMLKPKDPEKCKRIWRDENFFTVSTSVISLSEKCLYYSNAINKNYQLIVLSEKVLT